MWRRHIAQRHPLFNGVTSALAYIPNLLVVSKRKMEWTILTFDTPSGDPANNVLSVDMHLV